MSPFRPDLVDCWIFRDGASGTEILLLRRAPGRILAGLWQCVSGSLEPGEFFLPYPLEVEVGGATVFVMPVERFERI